MTQKSIPDKLKELFELFKSGALTQDEYDSLKSEIIHGEKNQIANDEEVSAKPEAKTESVIHTPPKEEIKHESVTKSETENKNPEDKPEVELESINVGKKEKQKIVTTTDKAIEVIKENTVWVILISVVLLIAVIFIFNTSEQPEKNSKKVNSTETKTPKVNTTVTSTPKVKTTKTSTVKDIDGNVYHTVKIGTQVWMVENLKTTKYNDGKPIRLVTDNSIWRKLTTPAYCWHNNDKSANKNTYGALYNWYAVNTQKLAPTGWHVPSGSDWNVLTNYLTNNGYGHQGSGNDISKSMASTTGWDSFTEIGAVGNNPSANNKSGFNAFPSGIRFSNGEFRHAGQNSKWWSSTGKSTTSAQIRYISWNDGLLASYSNRKENGFSVRCVKD